MKSRILTRTVILAVFGFLLGCVSYPGGSVESGTQRAEAGSCMAKPELALALRAFSPTKTLQEMDAVRRRLIKSAKLSVKCRTQVIGAIMEAMDRPQLDVYRDFNLWRYGSHLLGDLKATESLDLLIRHLSFTDGTSINVTHYPAMEGVIKIGRPAIPKLGAALRQNADISYRFKAVFCIAQIGGPTATQELRTSLASESDSCVRQFIQVSIDVLNNTRTPGQITAQDNERWFAALGCKE